MNLLTIPHSAQPRLALLSLLAVVLVRSATIAEDPAPARHPDERDGATVVYPKA